MNAQYCQAHKCGKEARTLHRQVGMGVSVLRTALSQRTRCIMRRPCIRFCTSSTLRCIRPISDFVKLLQCTSTSNSPQRFGVSPSTAVLTGGLCDS